MQVVTFLKLDEAHITVPLDYDPKSLISFMRVNTVKCMKALVVLGSPTAISEFYVLCKILILVQTTTCKTLKMFVVVFFSFVL